MTITIFCKLIMNCRLYPHQSFSHLKNRSKRLFLSSCASFTRVCALLTKIGNVITRNIIFMVQDYPSPSVQETFFYCRLLIYISVLQYPSLRAHTIQMKPGARTSRRLNYLLLGEKKMYQATTKQFHIIP